MAILFFDDPSSFPHIDQQDLRCFMNELEAVAPETRWTCAMLTTDGRSYWYRDHPDFPGDDIERRCRAYFDFAPDGVSHVSIIPATQEGDDQIKAEPWYQEYKSSTNTVVTVRGDS